MKRTLCIFVVLTLSAFLTAQILEGPPAPGTSTTGPALTAVQQNAINSVSAAFAADATQMASLASANAALQSKVAAIRRKGWLATNIPASNYYTSNIYADICRQASGFYNVGDAPAGSTGSPQAGSMSANGYPLGSNIHMRSQNWLYDVPAGTLNVTWTGTATLKLLIYGQGTWTQTGANSGKLVLPAGGPPPATQPVGGPMPILWIDVTSSAPSDPLDNLHIWQPGYGPGSANAGLMYRTDYTAILARFAGARFMAATNSAGSTEIAPADRVPPTSYDQTTRGCCVENCIELAKEAKLPRAWFCLPAASNAAYQQQVAQLIHDGLPGAQITIEYADEPWNSGAGFYAYSVVNALANTTAIAKYDGAYNAAGQFVPTAPGQPYVTDGLTRCVRAAADLERTMSRNVRPIFADSPARLKVCLSSQAGNSYWASEGLKWINAVYGNTDDFDVIIEAPYFTYWPDNTTTVATGTNGSYLLSDLASGVQSDFQRYVIPQVQAHAAIAKQYGKLHRLYEAGQAFYPPPGPFTGTDLASQYNYSREIAKDYALYYFYLRANGVDTCFDFNLGPNWWNQYGFWPTLQSLSTAATDPTGPTPVNWRFQAQMQACALWN
jgi:hypothetical protein